MTKKEAEIELTQLDVVLSSAASALRGFADGVKLMHGKGPNFIGSIAESLCAQKVTLAKLLHFIEKGEINEE